MKPLKVRPVLGFSVGDIRCLIRTRIAEDFGVRIITHKDNEIATEGYSTHPDTWMKLLRAKLVANTRTPSGVRLTDKGIKTLDDILVALDATGYRRRLTYGGQVSTIKARLRKNSKRRSR